MSRTRRLRAWKKKVRKVNPFVWDKMFENIIDTSLDTTHGLKRKYK